LALLVAVGFRYGFGPQGMVAGGVFGGIAAVLQTVATAIAAPKLGTGDYHGLLMRWAVGAGVRLLGVIAIPVAVLYDRAVFPPLPAALGFIAVLVPLLFLEIRRFR